jgi:hypothetical protein
MPAAKPNVRALTLVEPTAGSPFALLAPPYAEPHAVQRCSKVNGGAFVRIDA